MGLIPDSEPLLSLSNLQVRNIFLKREDICKADGHFTTKLKIDRITDMGETKDSIEVAKPRSRSETKSDRTMDLSYLFVSIVPLQSPVL